MRTIEKRIERAEAIVQSTTISTAEREAKLQELKRLEDSGDPTAAFILAAELEYGPNWSLAQVMLDAAKRNPVQKG